MKIREIILKILPYVGVFVLTVFVTGFIINREGGVERYNTDEASLPVLFMEKNDENFNIIRGYKGEMEDSYVRNWVYPMNSDSVVKLAFEKYKSTIKVVKYEAMEMRTRSVIDSGMVEDLKDDGTFVKGTIDLSTKIKDNKEYFLKLTVSTTKGDYTYSTRIMYPENREYVEALDFAKNFHKTTFNKNADTAISNYLETRTDINNNNLAKTNIGSSYDNITWTSMDVSYYSEPQYNFSEINSSFTGIINNYIIQVKDGENLFFYNVEEYYRVRKTDGKLYLLDYNRYIDQIYDTSKPVVKDGAILLGITGEESPCKTSESGSACAFVDSGELFAYNSHTGRMAKVFGYMTGDLKDRRTNNKDHTIRIIKVDESGNVDFAVIGYMNAGEHEGETGIAVFNYNSQMRQVTEEVFFKMNQPHRVVSQMIGKIIYVNNHNELYIVYDNVLYKVNLKDKSITQIEKDLNEDIYTVSDDGHLVAISNSRSQYDITELKVLNLDSGKSYVIKAPEGSKISPIGFMGVDIVYGTARDSDIRADAVGNGMFLMNKITIGNEDGGVREYDQKSFLVSKAYIEGAKVVLKRINQADGSEAIDDSIVNLKENNKVCNSVGYVNVGALKQQRGYIYANGADIPEKIEKVEPEYVKARGDTMDSPFEVSYTDKYFAYGEGKVVAISSEAGVAIAAADKASGVVLDAGGQSIWIKGAKSRQRELSGYGLDASGNTGYEVCVQMMLDNIGIRADVSEMMSQGMTPVEVLKNTLKVPVINLSGCSMDCALNFISEGAPVLAVAPGDKAVLIIAYDPYNVTLASPSERKTYKMSLDDARKSFASAGNLFITYKK